VTSRFARMYVRWPGSRMHVGERARVALSALRAVTPYVDADEWAPSAKKRPVIDPVDPAAADILRSMFAKARVPGRVGDPDDGYGNESEIRLAAPIGAARATARFGMQAGSEPIVEGAAADGNDYVVLTHDDDSAYRAALEDDEGLLEEFAGLVGAVACGRWATLTLSAPTHPRAVKWSELWQEIGRNNPMGSAMWFSDRSGWDLSAVPAELVRTSRVHEGTLIVARVPATELGTETATAMARGVAAGAPAAATV
jgi:hypothetical protein